MCNTHIWTRLEYTAHTNSSLDGLSPCVWAEANINKHTQSKLFNKHKPVHTLLKVIYCWARYFSLHGSLTLLHSFSHTAHFFINKHTQWKVCNQEHERVQMLPVSSQTVGHSISHCMAHWLRFPRHSPPQHPCFMNKHTQGKISNSEHKPVQPFTA